MALAAMRRHRRWLFVFLWLVIAAFIILYIPAFQGADAGSPGEAMATVGGMPITVGEFRRSYLRQRQRLEQLYQGRLDPDALRSMGIEEQVFSALVEDRLVAPGGSAAGPLRRRRDPGPGGGGALPGERPLHRLRGDPPAPGAPGQHGGGARAVAARGAPARAAGASGHRRRGRHARGGRARVPPPHGAGQGRVRAGGRGPVPGRGRRLRRGGGPPVRVGPRGLPDPRAARRAVSPGRRGLPGQPGHGDGSRDRGLLPGAPRGVQGAGRGLRQPRAGEGQGHARGGRGPP